MLNIEEIRKIWNNVEIYTKISKNKFVIVVEDAANEFYCGVVTTESLAKKKF